MKVGAANRRASLTTLLLLLWCCCWASSSPDADEQDKNNQVTPESVDRQTSSPPGEDPNSRRWTTGVWGPWSSWSDCSRTCGRGVATQTRSCQQESEYLRMRRMRHSRIHGNNDVAAASATAKRCLGVYRRFQLCSDKVCEGVVDMRREQCAAFDRQPFYGSLYKWEPFLKDSSRCELQCRPVGQRFYATLAKVVEDGTPCGTSQLQQQQQLSGLQEDSICVAGQCKPVGCDGVIGSASRWDMCRVCGGNNSTCRPISGIFTRPSLPVGYNLVAIIPRGARNVRINELARSKNFLALLSTDGSSVLNGNWSIGRSGRYPSAGTVFLYHRHSDSNTGQSITAPGPIDRDLQLMLIYQQRNPGVQYAYSLPIGSRDEAAGEGRVDAYALSVVQQRRHNVTKLPKNTKHRWKHQNKYDRRKTTAANRPAAYDGSNWVAGVRNRGNSTRTYRKSPRNTDFRRRFNPDRAASLTESGSSPKDVLNDIDVPATIRDIHWKMMGFTDCSKTCGGGTRLAAATCFSERHKAIVADSFCQDQRKPPSGSLPCNTNPCSSLWTVGEWSECSTSCGEGKQVRKVTCDGDASSCASQEAPPTARSCNLQSCFRWDTSEWGQCSTTCGSGVRRRRVRCVRESSRDPSEPSRCTGPRPPEEEPCRSSQPCGQQADPKTPATPEWMTTEWDRTECVGGLEQDACVEQQERRQVICGRGDHQVPDGACPGSSRPPEVQPCAVTRRRPPAGCDGHWFAGPWSTCPMECGGEHEQQRRHVVCLSLGPDRTLLSNNRCSGRPRPESERKCSRSGHCPPDRAEAGKTRWYLGQWGQCSSSCGSTGVQNRAVLCLGECGDGASSSPSQDRSRRPCPGDRPPCVTPALATGAPLSGDLGCVDKYTNCHLVVQSRLCHYGYYSDICCRSCATSLT